MPDEREKEKIVITRSKTAYTTDYAVRHAVKDYDVVSDETSKEGVRTIVLKPSTLTPERDRLVEENTDMIMKSLKDSSPTLRGIIFDTVKNGTLNNLRKLNKMLKSGKKVSTSSGCFRLYVGDGRKKNSVALVIKD